MSCCNVRRAVHSISNATQSRFNRDSKDTSRRQHSTIHVRSNPFQPFSSPVIHALRFSVFITQSIIGVIITHSLTHSPHSDTHLTHSLTLHTHSLTQATLYHERLAELVQNACLLRGMHAFPVRIFRFFCDPRWAFYFGMDRGPIISSCCLNPGRIFIRDEDAPQP